MGKFNGNRSNLVSSGRLNFDSKFDARLKLLNKTQPVMNDARELLLKKQQKQKIKNLVQNTRNISTNLNKNEPVIIVTGLANVKKAGDKLKIIKRPTSQPSQHRVIAKGTNTIITLNNSSLDNQNELISDDELEEEKSNLNNIKQFKIKIDNTKNNTKMQYNHQVEEEEVHNYNLKKTQVFYNSSYKDSEMEIEDSYSNISRSNSIDLLNNGYKLIISNLHPKVTEDDILELFSDVGPIKRARFLDKGLAEVVYVKLEHAKEAILKYDKNELDGRQMRIEFVNKASSKEEVTKPKRLESFFDQERIRNVNSAVNKPITLNSSIISNTEPIKNSLSNKFKSVNANKGETVQFSLPDQNKKLETGLNKVPIDNGIIQQVLFNKKSTPNSNPVTFTVKL